LEDFEGLCFGPSLEVEHVIYPCSCISSFEVAAKQLHLDKKHVLANAVNIMASVYEV
jgi:hypothetical protein